MINRTRTLTNIARRTSGNDSSPLFEKTSSKTLCINVFNAGETVLVAGQAVTFLDEVNGITGVVAALDSECYFMPVGILKQTVKPREITSCVVAGTIKLYDKINGFRFVFNSRGEWIDSLSDNFGWERIGDRILLNGCMRKSPFLTYFDGFLMHICGGMLKFKDRDVEISGTMFSYSADSDGGVVASYIEVPSEESVQNEYDNESVDYRQRYDFYNPNKFYLTIGLDDNGEYMSYEWQAYTPQLPYGCSGMYPILVSEIIEEKIVQRINSGIIVSGFGGGASSVYNGDFACSINGDSISVNGGYVYLGNNMYIIQGTSAAKTGAVWLRVNYSESEGVMIDITTTPVGYPSKAAGYDRCVCRLLATHISEPENIIQRSFGSIFISDVWL